MWTNNIQVSKLTCYRNVKDALVCRKGFTIGIWNGATLFDKHIKDQQNVFFNFTENSEVTCWNSGEYCSLFPAVSRKSSGPFADNCRNAHSPVLGGHFWQGLDWKTPVQVKQYHNCVVLCTDGDFQYRRKECFLWAIIYGSVKAKGDIVIVKVDPTSSLLALVTLVTTVKHL